MFIIIRINTYTFSKQWSCGIVAKEYNKLEPTTNVQMSDNDHTVGIMVDSRDDQQKQTIMMQSVDCIGGLAHT